jgi:hypothetical protein
MTVRYPIRCAVCGTVTVLRIQAGWLAECPLRITCGCCGISIYGAARFGTPEDPGSIQLNNASHADEGNAKFYMAASAELLTDKLQVYGAPLINATPTPFIDAFGQMGGDGLETFANRTQSFLKSSGEDWIMLKRVHELWVNGQSGYFAAEITRMLPEQGKDFDLSTKLGRLRAVRLATMRFLQPIIDENHFKSVQTMIANQMALGMKAMPTEISNMWRDFEVDGLLWQYGAKVLDVISDFVALFPTIIPAFGLRFYNSVPADLVQHKGITTASPDDLRHFYDDAYETATEIMRIVVAYNNLVHRGHLRCYGEN